ncbi:MAG TPA: outer membrane beta-barrel protein [Flavitalea sp.]|nr:outer membrane beta-barrel protein [Flavitalea sp.]
MYNLLWQKKTRFVTVALFFIVAVAGNPAVAQLREIYLPDHDEKKYYLGIGLLYNVARFQVSQHPVFLESDSVLVTSPENSGGVGLAGMHTYRLSRRFEVRAIFPQLIFAYKNITYNLKYPDGSKDETSVMTKKVESILVGLPIHLKFRSDRIDNFRVYLFGGAKFEYDLASNARAKRAEEIVKLKKIDMGVEAGIGFNFYFPVFILSPEIKISNGLINSHSREPDLKFSSAIDKLNSRMVVFSLIFEG